MIATMAASLLALVSVVAGEQTPTIEASFREPGRRPTELFVVFRNPSPQAISFTGLAHVSLKGTEDYWGPFDLQRFAPIGPNLRTTLELDAGATKRIVIDLRDLLWGKSIHSIWPSTPFGEAIPEGSYSVTVELEGTDTSRVASPPIQGSFTIVTGAAPSARP